MDCPGLTRNVSEPVENNSPCDTAFVSLGTIFELSRVEPRDITICDIQSEVLQLRNGFIEQGALSQFVA